MDFDSSDNGGAKYCRKVKAQTFKQFQLEKLVSEGWVIPASKLAEAKEMELQHLKDFEIALEDEQRHRRVDRVAPKDKLATLPLTRERFEW